MDRSARQVARCRPSEMAEPETHMITVFAHDNKANAKVLPAREFVKPCAPIPRNSLLQLHLCNSVSFAKSAQALAAICHRLKTYFIILKLTPSIDQYPQNHSSCRSTFVAKVVLLHSSNFSTWASEFCR